MKLNTDSHTVEIPCGQCGKKHPQTIGWLKHNKHISCTCGARISVDASGLEQGLARAQKSVDDLAVQLRKLGQR